MVLGYDATVISTYPAPTLNKIVLADGNLSHATSNISYWKIITKCRNIEAKNITVQPQPFYIEYNLKGLPDFKNPFSNAL